MAQRTVSTATTVVSRSQAQVRLRTGCDQAPALSTNRPGTSEAPWEALGRTGPHTARSIYATRRVSRQTQSSVSGSVLAASRARVCLGKQRQSAEGGVVAGLELSLDMGAVAYLMALSRHAT